MNTTLRAQAETIVTASIHAVLPDEAVRRALQGFAPAGRVFLAAAGKAAWQMAHAAVEVLGRPDGGVSRRATMTGRSEVAGMAPPSARAIRARSAATDGRPPSRSVEASMR